MRSVSMDLINSEAYLKGNESTNALNNLKRNLRQELFSINMINDADDDFDNYL